ncbi:hypothetical protein J3459_018154 [Metarhizium acridum]|uniref:uncharacterized protein n=1 Tax=Metarhizium acridum TaxID=92637 RepID=UPI001C6CCE68|nr:hypothetical protein J3459_018154 [Metarhizium acridum]KAG8413058.1 hypothetical protein J3458_013477 [Metarhizium acridum]
MQRVFDGRVRATFDKFKPYDKFEITAVTTDGATAIDFDGRVAKNKGSITKEKLQELWEQHVDGRPVTEKIVADFKPLADYTPTIKENAQGQIDMQETFANAIAENPWIKASWFRWKYLQRVRGSHQENIKELRTALESIEPLVCVKPEARKREVGRLDRRQSSDACFPWEFPELKEIVDLPPATEGSEGVTSPETLVAEEGAATDHFVERAKRANQVSVEEFDKTIGERRPKIPDSWEKKGATTFNEVRQRLGYKALEPTSPELVPGNGGMASGTLESLGGAVGSVLWVKGIVQSLLSDSTALDKLACLYGYYPLYRVYASVYSHSYTDPTQSFAAKLESAFVIGTVSVLSEAAQRIGALNASGSPDLHGSNALGGEGEPIDLAELETGTQKAIYRIQQDKWHVVARRQREFLLGIPQEFANGKAFSVSELAKELNNKLIEQINEATFIRNYPDRGTADDSVGAWLGGPLTQPADPYSEARAQMQEITEVSTEGIPGLYRFYTLIRHTHQTALFLQGRLKEEELDDSISPVDNLDLLKGLRLVAAMKLGRIYEVRKIEYLDNYYTDNPYILSPTAPPLIINPYIPPVGVLDSPYNYFLVGLAIGLMDGVSGNDLRDEVTQYLKTETWGIRLKNWQAMQKKIKAMRKIVTKMSQRQYTGPLSPEEFLSKHLKTCRSLDSF